MAPGFDFEKPRYFSLLAPAHSMAAGAIGQHNKLKGKGGRYRNAGELSPVWPFAGGPALRPLTKAGFF
jgi:hypothetical protein